MFVWHRPGIFSKWHTVVFFPPPKISLNSSYLCPDHTWLNFFLVFPRAVHPPLHLGQHSNLRSWPTHTCPTSGSNLPRPRPSLDHIPNVSATPHKCWTTQEDVVICNSKHAGVWFPTRPTMCPAGVFVGRGLGGGGKLWGSKCCAKKCALKGTYGHGHTGSAWHVLQSKVRY